MTIQSIPLSQLQLSADNVRQSEPNPEKLIELKASILQVGLLQNLIVKSNGNGYDVIAGGRRLRALQELQAEQSLSNDSIPCLVVDNENGQLNSLVENMTRENMHPVDEFVIFTELVKDGHSTADIAKKWGMDEKLVKQRMALGKLHPTILQAVKDDKVDWASAKAFTMVPSQEQQLEIYEHNDGRVNAHCVKSALSHESYKLECGYMQFVGREAYTAKGGRIVEDLFDPKNSMALDGQLLKSMVWAKAEKLLELYKDNFAWIEFTEDYPDVYKYRQGFAVEGKTILNDDHTKQMTELEAIDYDDRSYYQNSLLRFLQDLSQGYKDPVGVIIRITPHSDFPLEIENGLVKPSDFKKQQAENGEPQDISKLSDALTNDLLSIRQQIMQGVISTDTNVGLDLLIFQFMKNITPRYTTASTDISTGKTKINDVGEVIESSNWVNAIRPYHDSMNLSWFSVNEPVASMEALKELPLDDKIEILSYVAGIHWIDSDLTDYVGQKCNINIRQYWNPTYDNTFKRMNVTQLLDIAQDIYGKEWVEQNKVAKKKDIATALHNACNNVGDVSGVVLERGQAWVPDVMDFKQVENTQAEQSEPDTDMSDTVDVQEENENAVEGDNSPETDVTLEPDDNDNTPESDISSEPDDDNVVTLDADTTADTEQPENQLPSFLTA